MLPSNARTSPTLQAIFPKLSALMVMAIPQEPTAGKSLPCALPLSHFLFQTEGSQCVPEYMYTHTPLLCVSLNLREIQDAFIQDSSVQFSRDLCDIGSKGRRVEGRALSDYYHHYDFHNNCFLLTGMILFELCSVFSTAPIRKCILPSLLGLCIR